MSVAQAAAVPLAAACAMTGAPFDVAADGDWRVASGWLDPAQPFLADHKPGGSPLLGTVGGLEVLADWIAAVDGAPAIVALQAVEAIRPILFEGGTPRRVSARWRVGGTGRAQAELLTSVGDGETVHVRCVFVTGEAERPEAGACVPPQRRDAGAVSADEIYRVFFHGPAFRVVARAQVHGRAVLSQLAPSLPRWSTTSGASHVAPRLIEFGLQTAGLLQLALDGAMMIPRSIVRVDRYRPTDVDRAAPLYASAERAGADPAEPIDVSIVDADGTVHLGITGYRCVPLPFHTDDARLTTLAELLRATATGSQA